MRRHGCVVALEEVPYRLSHRRIDGRLIRSGSRHKRVEVVVELVDPVLISAGHRAPPSPASDSPVSATRSRAIARSWDILTAPTLRPTATAISGDVSPARRNSMTWR